MIICPGFKELLNSEEIPDCLGIVHTVRGGFSLPARSHTTGFVNTNKGGYVSKYLHKKLLETTLRYSDDIEELLQMVPFHVNGTDGYVFVGHITDPLVLRRTTRKHHTSPESFKNDINGVLELTGYTSLCYMNFTVGPANSSAYNNGLVEDTFLRLRGAHGSLSHYSSRVYGGINYYAYYPHYMVTGFHVPNNVTQFRQLRDVGLNLFTAEELLDHQRTSECLHLPHSAATVSDVVLHTDIFKEAFRHDERVLAARVSGALHKPINSDSFKEVFKRGKRKEPLFLSVQGPDFSKRDRWFCISPSQKYVSIEDLCQGVESGNLCDIAACLE